jgi:hypothetical protein
MLKSIKIYLALCLIGLQLIAPFIHAHAFGLDSFNERSAHIHANLTPQFDVQNVQSATSYQDVQVVNAADSQISYVITVATGVNSPTDADVVLNILFGIALFVAFTLLLKHLSQAFIFSPVPPLFHKRLVCSNQNPRAPPR